MQMHSTCNATPMQQSMQFNPQADKHQHAMQPTRNRRNDVLFPHSFHMLFEQHCRVRGRISVERFPPPQCFFMHQQAGVQLWPHGLTAFGQPPDPEGAGKCIENVSKSIVELKAKHVQEKKWP